MGNVRSGDFDMDISGKFAELNIYTREDCRNCWARFYCSGGCSASNLLVNGDIKKPNAVACEMERKRLECAIALRALRPGWERRRIQNVIIRTVVCAAPARNSRKHNICGA